MKTYMGIRSFEDIETVTDSGTIQVYFDFEEVENDGMNDEEAMRMLRCESVEVPFARLDYGGIVSAIVNGRYKADDVTAIIANYENAKDADSELDGDKRQEYIGEYATFQQWRKRAKEVAKVVLEKIKL